jgi:arylsulfatase A-like enzyme
METSLTDRHPWLLPLAGGLAALSAALADGLASGLDAGGAVILCLRGCGVGLLAGALQWAMGRAATRTGSRVLEPGAMAIAAVAWSIWIGAHLARTATLRAALPPLAALIVPIAAGLPILWLALALQQRLLVRGIPLPAALVALAIGALLLVPTRWLADLHPPLSLSCAVIAWLALELGLAELLARAPRLPGRELALLAAGIGLVSPLLPLPLADAFSAADRSAALGLLVRGGRTQTVTLHEALADAELPEAADEAERDAKDLLRAPGRSLVLISIDALRADRLGTAGYGRELTPALDDFARQAIAFTRAYAPSPTSSFSLPALHAGMPMEALLRAGGPIPETLADRLGAAGYATLGLFPKKIFSAGPELLGRIERSGFGFARTVVLSMEARADGVAVRRALESEDRRPVFLWIHLYDPHLPYDCHDERFGTAPADCYDAEIAHADAAIGRLLPWLDDQLDRPVIAITADHGEAFGEHGRLYHSADLHEEQIRVPLLIRVPGAEPGEVATPVSIADLPATLHGLVAPEGAAPFAGHDLRPLMAGSGEPPPVTGSIRDKRAIVDQELKLLCNDWPDGPCALFDLEVDPGETRNLIAERPTAAARLLGRLKQLDRAELERLRGALPRPIVLARLGRAEAASELLDLARDQSSPHRVDAARALAMLRRPELAPSLEELHGSEDDAVAAWACVGSALLGEPCPAEHLAPLAREHSDLGLWSAVALGHLGDRRALPPLIDNLKTGDPGLRAESALALGALGDRRAVGPLIRLLDVKQTRWAAIEALGALGDERAVGPLTRLRQSEPDETNLPRYDRALVRILGP